MSAGFRVVQAIERVPEATVGEYRRARLATPNVADVMWRFGAVGEGIHALGDVSCYLAGPALTVRTRPTDNLMVHKALEVARPGDVILVEAGGEMRHAILGELMCRYAAERGIAGFVVDIARLELRLVSPVTRAETFRKTPVSALLEGGNGSGLAVAARAIGQRSRRPSRAVSAWCASGARTAAVCWLAIPARLS